MGDDDVGVAFRRFDERQMRGPHGSEVLGDDRLLRSAPLMDVALEAADEPDVGIGVDKDLQVHVLAK